MYEGLLYIHTLNRNVYLPRLWPHLPHHLGNQVVQVIPGKRYGSVIFITGAELFDNTFSIQQSPIGINFKYFKCANLEKAQKVIWLNCKVQMEIKKLA